MGGRSLEDKVLRCLICLQAQVSPWLVVSRANSVNQRRVQAQWLQQLLSSPQQRHLRSQQQLPQKHPTKRKNQTRRALRRNCPPRRSPKAAARWTIICETMVLTPNISS